MSSCTTGGVAVIVVNYGTADLTCSAVESVFANCSDAQTIEVHVVDNASPGGDAERLKDFFANCDWGEQVTLWPETTNHGFGRGNNVVLTALTKRECPPEFVFLLNPDARLENSAIDILMGALDADPEAAGAGAALVDSNGTPSSSAFRFPSCASELARTIDFGPVAKLLARYRVPLLTPTSRGQVDWVTGAAVMFRLRPLADAGFFDPDYFLYFEEVDLMRRLQVAGWHMLHVPEAHVVHEEGAATGVHSGDDARRRNPPYLYESWRHYFVKSKGSPKTLLIALSLYPAAVLNVIQRRVRGLAPTLPSEFFRDHWRFVVKPLIFGQDST